MTLKELYNEAEKEDIKIIKYDLGQDLIWKGECLCDDCKNCMIFLNEHILEESLEKCTLAHELGHYHTFVLQNNVLSSEYRDTLIRSINDFRANKWAIGKLIPFHVFKKFLNTNMTKFEVAECLNVTVEVVELACHIYEPLLKL